MPSLSNIKKMDSHCHAALPPTITVSFGVTNAGFIEQVRGYLKDEDVLFESEEELHWGQYGYRLKLIVAAGLMHKYTPSFGVCSPVVLRTKVAQTLKTSVAGKG